MIIGIECYSQNLGFPEVSLPDVRNICIAIISGPEIFSEKSINECLKDNIERMITVFNETLAYYKEINDYKKISFLKTKKIILAVINLVFFEILQI